MAQLSEMLAFLDRFAPANLAADWDNTGLLVGEPAGVVDRVLTCLTLTSDVVAEAVAERVGLIVSHHPVLFQGAKKLTPSTPDGRIVLPLLRAECAVYSPHTAFDHCPGGINDGLAARLGLGNVRPLRPRVVRRDCKLVVFVPETDLARVSEAIFAAGGGVIGQYEQCSYRIAGTGTFFGTESTTPTLGAKGRREEVAEWRLEVLVPEERVDSAVSAMRRAHSYEEPAYDIYPLRPGLSGGEGRIGELSNPVPLGELARLARTKLAADSVQTVGDLKKPVSRVALACGAAGEFLPDAVIAKADVFLTGEMRFHDCIRARELGIGTILPGHYATERPGVEDLAVRLAAEFPDATVWASRNEREPVVSLE